MVPFEHNAANSICGAVFNASSNLRSILTEVLALLQERDQNLDFLLLPDSGYVDQTVVQALQPDFCISHSPPGPDGWVCAIIYKSNLAVRHGHLKDAAGRAVGIDLALPGPARGKPRYHRVITFYQPPNLDRAPEDVIDHGQPDSISLTGRTGSDLQLARRLEAERVRRLVLTWATAPSVVSCTAAGDCNETFCGIADRLHGGKSRPGSWRFGTIHRMVCDDGWNDMYRDLHPAIDDDSARDSWSPGHTFFYPGGGSSRIDYVLTRGVDYDSATASCRVDNTGILGSDMGHRPVFFTLPITTIALPANESITKTIDVTRLRPEDREAFVLALSSAALATDAVDILEKLRANDPAAESVLENVAVSLAAVVHKIAAEFHILSSGLRPGRKRRLPREVLDLLRTKRTLCALCNVVREKLHTTSVPTTAWAPTAGAHIATLTSLGALGMTGLTDRAPWTDVDWWWAWLHRRSTHLRAVRRLQRQANPPRHRPHRTNFTTAWDRGRFYRSTSSGWSRGGPLGHAVLPDGQVLRDAPAYMDALGTEVAQRFATERTGPAVLATRMLSDAEIATGIPRWWEQTYARSNSAVIQTVWDTLMRPCTPCQLQDELKKAPSRRSPGTQGLPLDVLKLAAQHAGPAHGDRFYFLQALVSLTNALLRTGICPSALKTGIIVFIPKPGKPADGPSTMRPITLLPELGKLPARLLSGRLTDILHLHPHVLHPSQRAYLRDGSSRQSLSTLMDVLEDFYERRRRFKGRRKKAPDELVLLSYDVVKAFDKVQKFSVRASCERLNLPESFITYLLSTMTNATSSVRCKDGLTKPFALYSSVRQGDPLSALVFIFVMDALHCGLQTHGGGYDLMDHGATVHSLGYSDDTAAVSATWAGAREKHEWVREFFVAHHLRFDGPKSHCIIGSGDVALRTSRDRVLPGIRECDVHDPRHNSPAVPIAPFDPDTPGECDICACNPDKSFRYLGFLVRVDLNPSPMVAAMSGRVYAACRHIRLARLHLGESGQLLSEFLYPRLALGLTYAHVPRARLHKWDAALRSAVRGASSGIATQSISNAALYIAMGVEPLTVHSSNLQIVETGIMLRSTAGQHSVTATARLQRGLAGGAHANITMISTQLAGRELHITSRAVATRCNRVARALRHAVAAGVGMSVDTRRAPPPTRRVLAGPAHDSVVGPLLPGAGSAGALRTFLIAGSPHSQGPGLVAFTDGSWTDGKSGYAVVICRAVDVHRPGYNFEAGTYVCLQGTAPASAANYSAEVQAILSAVHAVPADVHLLIVSDCLSALQSAWRRVLPDGQRIRLGARPQIVAVRGILALRAAAKCPAEMLHVHSHTGLRDVFSRGNELADKLAAEAVATPAAPLLATEEAVVFWDMDNADADAEPSHICGDLLRVLRRKAQTSLLNELQAMGSQGAIARQNGHALVQFLRKLRSRGGELHTFVFAALCRHLPTADRLVRGANRTCVALQCPLCLCPQSAEHAFLCSGNHLARSNLERTTYFAVRRLCTLECVHAITTSAHAAALHKIPEKLRFCDPRTDIPAVVAWATSAVSMDFGRRTARVLHADWFSSQIGLLPPGLLALILPPWAGEGGAAFKAARRTLSVAASELQISLAAAALKCFRQWSQLVELHARTNVVAYPVPPWRQPPEPPATDIPSPVSPANPCVALGRLRKRRQRGRLVRPFRRLFV